ncbi:MAG: MarR family transcriptional regulator [Ilumatobacteraceae bacterium]|nr:MarR family transcriptional regulator [Ilumatobacteraceae bacterium]
MPRSETTTRRASAPLDENALYHLGGHLAVVHRRVQRADEVSLHTHGVTSAQARVIRSLARLDRPLQMSELASMLDIVPRSVTSVIDELEPMGLVERRPDPTDRRAVQVALTARGAALSPTLQDLHGRCVASVLTPLTAEEIVVLGDLLQRLAHTPADG